MPGDEPADTRRGRTSLDVLFEALAHERRRRVIDYFRGRGDDAAEVDELAEYVTTDDPGPDELEQVSLGLHHVHLPKLADAGIVEYDPRSNVARYRSDERLDGLLAAANRERDRDAPCHGNG